MRALPTLESDVLLCGLSLPLLRSYGNVLELPCSVPDKVDHGGLFFNVSQAGAFSGVNLFHSSGLAAQSANLIDVSTREGTINGRNGAFTQLICDGIDVLSACAQSVVVTPNTALVTGPARMTSDPRLLGFWGQDVYVGGQVGAVYSLLSDSSTLINSRFVQLDGVDIHCPSADMDAAVAPLATQCFAHSGSYMGELAVRTSDGRQLSIVAGALHEGFASLSVTDGQRALGVFDRLLRAVHPATLTVQHLSPRAVRIHAGAYVLDVHNMDHYLDIAQLNATRWDALTTELRPEGIIGRTWSRHAQPLGEHQLEQYREKNGELLGCAQEQQKHC